MTMHQRFMFIFVLLLFAGVATASPQIDKQKNRVVIRLDNGVRMQFILDGTQLKGLGQVWLNDTPLKSDRALQYPQVQLVGPTVADRKSTAWGDDPLSVPKGQEPQTLGGVGDYLRADLKTIQIDGQGVKLVTKITHKNTQQVDDLIWLIQPRKATVHGKTFHGFSYTYQFKSEQRQLFNMLDTFSWQPGGAIDNIWIMESGHAQSYLVKKKLTVADDLIPRECKDPAYKVYPKLYNLSHVTPLFNYTHFDFRFQYGDHGLLFAYNTKPIYGLRRILKPAGAEDLVYQHRYFYSRSKVAKTPEMIVLFNPDLKSPGPLEVESWHGTIYDYIHARRCATYGTKPPEGFTMAAKSYLNLIGPNYIQQNQRYLTRFADFGFQAIWWKGYEDNHDARRLGSIDYMHNLRPGAAFGGEDAAKEFCDYAHSLGIKVVVWCPTFYTGARSALAAAHPQWLLRDSDGQYQYKRYYTSENNVRNYGAYSELIAFDLHSDYRKHFMAAYRHLKDLGVDGVWMDSYPNITVDCVNYRAKDYPVYDTNPIFEMTAELMKMGYWTGYEGAGPLGVACAGSVSPIIDDRLFGYQRIYGWQKFFWAPGFVPEDKLTKNFYYMGCANRIPPAIVAGQGKELIERRCSPKLAKWIVQANRDYKAAYPYMQYRWLIPGDGDPDQEKAVEWSTDADKTIVLWSYEPFDYQLPAKATVTDLTKGGQVAVSGQVLRTKAWHTYKISR